MRFTHQIYQPAAEPHVGVKDAVPPKHNHARVYPLGHGTGQLRHLLRTEEASGQRTVFCLPTLFACLRRGEGEKYMSLNLSNFRNRFSGTGTGGLFVVDAAIKEGRIPHPFLARSDA